MLATGIVHTAFIYIWDGEKKKNGEKKLLFIISEIDFQKRQWATTHIYVLNQIKHLNASSTCVLCWTCYV